MSATTWNTPHPPSLIVVKERSSVDILPIAG